MSIHHTARSGKIYYLHAVPGKSGKTKYHFSTNPAGPLAEVVPEGYEIYENINGQVFLRRKTPQLISDEELALVKEALKRHAQEWRYRAEVKKDAIIVYEATQNIGWIDRVVPPWGDKASVMQSLIRNTNYMAVMRFVLDDQEERLFSAERFCFRGSVEDWIYISAASETLPAILKRFIKHLGKESFFELY